ncbi:glycoside hydrolase family 3 N-terminal domain-containing protein [Halopelagius fulvigenes]|uniref:beta-glucosidase n=1 Tax=Halopelagius fulvigenes TaxID=1198324 RepID=A0ABD5U1L5_9EURY
MDGQYRENVNVSRFVEQTRRQFLGVAGAGLLAAGGAGGVAATGDSDEDEDGDGADVENILESLSLEQKVGQMLQVNVGSLDPAEVGDYLTKYHAGSLLSGGANPPTNDPAELRKRLDELQRFAAENTDHGIPFAYGLDAVHGNVTVDGATAYPHNLGLGATRDPELTRKAAKATGESVRAVGAHWNFAPDADLQRDPRWGRFYEGFSEDPYLASEMVSAATEGMQMRDDGRVTVGATVKHFVGYSEPENGNDRSPAHIPMRSLRQKFFPPFRTGVRSRTESIMVNSGSVNGVPAHASKFLLTEVLREWWGFEGVVISDWDDFDRMITLHEYVPTFRDAVREGINAGVDVYMEPEEPERFVTTLVDLVESGEVETSRIDEAVERVLRFKKHLGLLDDSGPDLSVEEHVGAGRDTARKAATESMTLLKNAEGTLPISDADTVLVTGPNADNVRNQMGGWTLGWQGLPEDADAAPAAVTIVEGMKEAASDGTEIVSVPTGHTFNPYAPDEFPFDNESEVVDAAENADVAVVVVGEGPYSEGFGDTDTLELPGEQPRIVDAVAETGTPTVGVVVAGRPRGHPETMAKFDAALMAYQPGTEGGTAVGRTLFGETDPGGRLPFTWPHTTGDLINVYNHLPPANRGDEESQFPFGHGLSYTSFEYENLQISPGKSAGDGSLGTIEVSVKVTNTGDRAGTDVVEAYNTQSFGSVIHPDERLMGYERVSLKSGESKTVTIDAPLETLLVLPGDVPGDADELTIEDGQYAVTVGEMTETFTVGSGGYTDWEVGVIEEMQE